MRLRSICIAAALAAFAAGAAIAGPPLDGTREVANYPTALAVQTTQTQFGDANNGSLFANGGELDAFYATNDATDLIVMITGNLESNGNGLVIWIDNTADATGNSTAPAISGGDGYFTAGKLGGTIFPSGFNADYGIVVKCFNNPLEWRYQVADLRGAGSTGSGQGNFNTGATTNPAVNAQSGFTFALNNSNTAGVGGGAGAGTGGDLVSTGLEFAIPRSAIGSPANGTEIRMIALYANSNFDFWSNQVLPGLATPGGNIGSSFPVNFGAGSTTLSAPGYVSYTLAAVPASVGEWSSYD